MKKGNQAPSVRMQGQIPCSGNFRNSQNLIDAKGQMAGILNGLGNIG